MNDKDYEMLWKIERQAVVIYDNGEKEYWRTPEDRAVIKCYRRCAFKSCYANRRNTAPDTERCYCGVNPVIDENGMCISVAIPSGDFIK